ncbi:peptidoglycan D,D-transpeptidase FtsI family protein [Paenibacillus sp. TSA_86.1]|uniref:peptidoglycan D,D-transpeptidase FtsI family protein n=1 Tax=Paenibacillus sp. TSA_86.1 TaxID=3415649 RepID=UPI0040453A8B
MFKRLRNKPPNEDERAVNTASSARLNIFFFVAFVIFSILIFRLAFIQFVEGPELTYMESTRNTKEIPLAPVRGPIYDATGKVALAYSEPVQSLYVLLYEDYRNDDRRQEAENLARELADIFKRFNPGDENQPDTEEIIKRLDLDHQKTFGYVPRLVKSDLTTQEIAFFLEKKTEYPGVMVLEENVRRYDPDRVAVQVIGYTREFKGAGALRQYKTIIEQSASQRDPGLVYSQDERVGFDGLELQYQQELRGRSAYQSIDIDSRNLPTGAMELTPPEKGYSLISTINKEVQLAAQQAITDELRKLPKAITGYAVAMEVDTGNVVAMASMPDYDPNDWDYDKIKFVFRNGTTESFPPNDNKPSRAESVVLLGSVIKPLSVLIGLKEGLFTAGSTYHDKGYAVLGKDGRQVKNSHSAYNGNITARRAIEKSSNAFMIDMVGKRLLNNYGATKALDKWDGYMKDFGLGVSTGIDLPKEFLGQLEYKADNNESALTRLAFASFGQQAKYTTMQLAQYTTMLANKGKRMEPHLVKEIRDAEGNVVKEFKPKVLNEVQFADAHWNEVHKGMVTKVSAFDGFPYDFARKTGTSEQGTGPNKKENGVFIAFAPRDNPKLAVAVVVPEGGFGSVSASPIARKIFDAYDEVYGLNGIPKGKKDQEQSKLSDR